MGCLYYSQTTGECCSCNERTPIKISAASIVSVGKSHNFLAVRVRLRLTKKRNEWGRDTEGWITGILDRGDLM